MRSGPITLSWLTVPDSPDIDEGAHYEEVLQSPNPNAVNMNDFHRCVLASRQAQRHISLARRSPELIRRKSSLSPFQHLGFLSKGNLK